MSNYEWLNNHLLLWNNTAADARVAWPHSGTSFVGVNHLNPKHEPEKGCTIITLYWRSYFNSRKIKQGTKKGTRNSENSMFFKKKVEKYNEENEKVIPRSFLWGGTF